MKVAARFGAAVLVVAALSGCTERCEREGARAECKPEVKAASTPPAQTAETMRKANQRSLNIAEEEEDRLARERIKQILNGDAAALVNAAKDEEKPLIITEVRKRAAQRHEAEKKKLAASIAYHIKQLKNMRQDESDRATSAEYLGVLDAFVSVPDLIERLQPSIKEKDSVMRAANSSLVKLTGKNFGASGYEEWAKWWIANKAELIEQKLHAALESDRIAAESEDTHGLELMNMAEFRSAFVHFVMAIERNPKIPDYHNNAGLALLQLNRPLDAIDYFKDAISLNDKAPQPYLNIAMCYEKMNRADDAKLWREEALARKGK
ncbi:MAG TPA: hypothetical protein VKX17_28490 [Planctomycetota bacterium]|nr:hypothetical protein [Planctomycetota bacterium]